MLTTFADALSEYLATVIPTHRGQREESIRAAVLLRDPIAQVPLADLKRADVRAFRDRMLGRKLTGSTVNRYLALIGSTLKWAQVEFDFGPGRAVCSGMNRPENAARTRRLAAGEWERLLGAIPAGHWLREFIVVAVETGARRSELCALTFAAIDWSKRTAHLTVTKNGHPRTIPLSSAAVAALETVRGPLPRVGRVFDATPQTVTLAFGRTCTRAGLKGLRLHDLRAERISTLLEAGWAINEVAAVSGHRSLPILMRYARHNDPAALAQRLG